MTIVTFIFGLNDQVRVLDLMQYYTYKRIGAGASERFLGEMSNQRADVVLDYSVHIHVDEFEVVLVKSGRRQRRRRRRREMAERQ